jgi:hypothetical protein
LHLHGIYFYSGTQGFQGGPVPGTSTRLRSFIVPSSLRLNIFRLFVILSLTQLHLYTPEIFLFSTATFKFTYRAPPQTNWTRIVSERGLLKISVNKTDTTTFKYLDLSPVGKFKCGSRKEKYLGSVTI